RRLGVSDLAPMAKGLSLLIIDAEAPPTRRRARLAAARLPFPFSLAAAVLLYAHLPPSERFRSLRVIRKAAAEHRKRTTAHHGLTFAAWLERAGVGERAVRALWEPLVLATLNSLPQGVDAATGIMLLAEA